VRFELVTVACFGLRDRSLLERVRWADAAPGEAADFIFEAHDGAADVQRILRETRPQVLLSFGDVRSFPELWALPLDERRRWLHHDDEAAVDPAALAGRILGTFVLNATTSRYPGEPLVSVFTAACAPGARIERPLRSLLRQSYRNWEWVICDDSRDGGATFAQLGELAAQDARIGVHRADRPSGIIGAVKRRACGIARGDLLVELDHDDELTTGALADVVAAFAAYPDAGFAYSDFAEIFDDGGAATYGEGWAFGFGAYRRESVDGRLLEVAIAPPVNARTIRHIVSAPNHLRAWRRDAYFAAGGHATDAHVGDDYELCVRTFLATRMVHIRRCGYVQWLSRASDGNTQRVRNREIQRLVRLFGAHHEDAIHARLVALGVGDFLRPHGALRWDLPDPEPTPSASYEFP
jgi:glycosyltransferase involved in cell wall biosynthesis